MKTEHDDVEFQSWSKEAQYVFQERLGIICEDMPFSEIPLAVIAEARRQARKVNSERTNETD